MEMLNGVSEVFGKLTACKSGSSAHSTQQCKNNNYEQHINYPYMAEACGGDDDNSALDAMYNPRVMFY